MTNKLAVIHGRDQISYSKFINDIENTANWLSKNLDNAICKVSIEVTDEYWHWILTLAMLKTKCSSVSFFSNLVFKDHHHESVDLFITDEENKFEKSFIKFNSHAIEDQPNYSSRLLSINQLSLNINKLATRAIYTSGTTGNPKSVIMSAADIENRINTLNTQLPYEFDSDTKYLSMTGIITVGTFFGSLTTWLRGGTVILGKIIFDTKPKTLIALELSTIIATSPARLQNLLQITKGIWPLRDKRIVRVAGSRLHSSLRNEALEKIGARVQITYGSTEVGAVATCDALALDDDPGAAGQVFNNVQVEIVDGDHRVLPFGEVGQVRCKSVGMANAYGGETTSKQFQNGWFYPGDFGKITQSGWLTISGRNVDVLNLNGVKFSAVDIESTLLNIVDLKDVCVVLLDSTDASSLAIAVVHESITSIENIRKKIESTLPFISSFHLIRVPFLPRNEMGKLPRQEIINNLIKIINSGVNNKA